MKKLRRRGNLPEYKGLCYGENQNGDYVVLPHGVNDIDSPHAFHIASLNCKMTDAEKEKKAKKHIDFITTLEEGYEHIAGNAFHENTGNGGLQKPASTGAIPKVSWWVKIENGNIYIADTIVAPDGLSYLRPKHEEWMKATQKQIQLLNQLPLTKVI
jgi:hypothetical protein